MHPEPVAFDLSSHCVWRGSELLGAASQAPVCASGFAALDAVLPGGGWPTRAVVEVLQGQSCTLEWRLLGAALRTCTQTVALIAPPHMPFAPGLAQLGLPADRLLWVRPAQPAHAAWATEQALQCQGLAAVLAWLPQVRPVQMRRLQSHASRFDGLCFVMRPDAARHESSAAPLRVLASLNAAAQVELQVLKCRGPAHADLVRLDAFPHNLKAIKNTVTSKLGATLLLQKMDALAVQNMAKPGNKQPIKQPIKHPSSPPATQNPSLLASHATV